MSVFFCDTSGLVKRFTREKGTAWILNLLKPSNGNTIFIARITSVEVVAALTKQNRIGNLTASELDKFIKRFKRSLQNRYAFVELNENLANQSMLLAEKYGLRGYDSVQLAAALKVEQRRISLGLSSIVFVCADNNLNAAALGEGLAVENPNNYP